MAFPTVRSTGSGLIANAVSQVITLPTNQAGDLMIIFASRDANDTWNTVTGWTLLASNNQTANSVGVWYKISDGSESNPTLSWGSKEQGTWAVVVYTSGTFTGTPVASSVATGSSANPNSLSLTSGFGTVDTRFLSFWGTDSVETTTTYPTNYALEVAQVAASTQAASLGVGFYNVNAASEDPGQFVISGSETWIAFTIAIEGTVGSSAPTVKVNIGGVWKDAEMFVNVGGVWKSIEDLEVNIGGTWKTWTS